MSLGENIHRLTRVHLTMAGGKVATMPALLEQLDQAMTSRQSRPTGGGGDPIPVSAAAISLRQDIEFSARDEQYQRTGSDVGRLEIIIQSWVSERDPEMVAYLEHVTLEWCDRISTLITPAKPPWRPAVPCPSCGVIYDRDGNGPGLRVHCWGDDEAMLPPGRWTAECIHCRATWTAENMPWLARVLEAAA